MHHYTFVYPPTVRWDRLVQRPHQLLRALAALGHTCYFCDAAGGEGIEEVEPRLHVVRDASDLPKRLSRENPIVLLCSHPGNIDWAERIRADHVIFDYLDLAVDEFSHWAPGLEQAIGRADLVLVVSERLAEEVAGKHPRLHLVRNGSRPEDFRNAAEGRLVVPADLAEIRKRGPVVGFYGAIASWVDAGLMAAVAQRCPQYQFVFIGPTEFYPGPLEALRAQPNVHFLGERPYTALPAYAQGFDAATIPFETREMLQASSPVKMYEYLAAGLPVVATPIREAMGLAPVVQIAATIDEWVAALDRAVKSREGDYPGTVARLTLARNNSWANRAKQVAAALGELASANGAELRVPEVGFELQAHFEQLVAYRDAITAQIDALAGSGQVCLHSTLRRNEKMAQAGMVMCLDCRRLIPAGVAAAVANVGGVAKGPA